jgi:hypothetical protein
MLHISDLRGTMAATECEFKGRQNGKIRFAILASASLRGGIEADLLGPRAARPPHSTEIIFIAENFHGRQASKKFPC